MTETDVDLARSVAVAAGELLVRVRREFTGDSPRALGDEGDLRANDLIQSMLAQARPDDAVLSEESPDNAVRLAAPRLWIVDPLDGTSEYRSERDEFAVHVALWSADEPARAGLRDACIALPERGRVWTTADPVQPPPELDPGSPITLVVSRSHLPESLMRVRERLAEVLREEGHGSTEVELLHVGSVGAKVDEVLIGNAHAYVFGGGLSEWDTAAPFAVAEHHDYVALDGEGAPYVYNKPNVVVDGGFLAHPTLAPLLLRATRGAGL